MVNATCAARALPDAAGSDFCAACCGMSGRCTRARSVSSFIACGGAYCTRACCPCANASGGENCTGASSSSSAIACGGVAADANLRVALQTRREGEEMDEEERMAKEAEDEQRHRAEYQEPRLLGKRRKRKKKLMKKLP